MDSSGKKLTKSSIFRCGLPIELMNELFASMPLGKAFCLLARMPNGLLARNLQKMYKGIKEAMKNNKLNEQECGPKLTISEGGLVLKHCGPKGGNCVRAVLPIPAFNLKGINNSIIAFYFEVQILNRYGGCNTIGFCEQQFPLELEESKWLGSEKNSNSIGIHSKGGIWIDGSWIEFKNVDGYFKKDDFVGFGIIHHKNSETECFVTWNCQFMGKCQLPSNFADLQLFPAINLFVPGGSIRLNFGNEKWQFKDFGCVLKYGDEELKG